ncbi:MAG: pilus assembly protein TadG-related protein [Vicinamibacterales bacterium]
MSSVRRHRGSERGAVLVHVAIATVGLLALCALAVDFGIKWIARAQAQNAADAGALAGAISLSFDDPDDLTDTGMAKQSARQYALANLVWGEAPDVDVTTDITFPTCPDGTDTCVRVDVYRNQQRSNPLPTFFAQFVGVMSQGVRATATAQVLTGNATDCLKPWAVVDRWDEFNPPEPPDVMDSPDPDFNPQSTFDRYSNGQGNNPPQEADLYVPPTQNSPGTGFTVSGNFGTQYAIKTGAPGNAAVSSGWFRSVDLPRVDTANLGGNAYGANIVSCNGYPTAIASPGVVCPSDGSQISTHEEKVYWASRGCVRVQTGVIQGQTYDGIEQIFNRDPYARWNPSLNDGLGGIQNSSRTPSDRIVPIAVMDIDSYLAADPSGSGGVIKIVNILGFFIEGLGDVDGNGNIIFDPANPMPRNGKAVVGRLMTMPGMAVGNGNIDEDASFLMNIILVR